MLEHRTMHGMVVDELGRRIVAGMVSPGDTLPVENDLADQLGVSRGALREAVKALVAKGMLAIRPRTGTRVLPEDNWNHLDADVLRWQRAANPDRLLADVVELRRGVEPEAARLAAARSTEARTDALTAALAGMEEAAGRSDRAAYVAADIAFHRAVLDASGNRLLASLGRAVEVALEHSFSVSLRDPAMVEASLIAHRAVVDAILSRDAEAASARLLEIIDSAAGEIVRARHPEPVPVEPPVRP